MSFFRGASKALQRYAAEVRKASEYDIQNFFKEEVMLWDFSKPECMEQWDCICDYDIGGHSYATFEPNSKGINQLLYHYFVLTCNQG